MKFLTALLAGFAFALVANVAGAQEAVVPHAPAFEIDRLTPAPGPGTFWQVEDGDLARAGERAFGIVSSIETNPLVIRDLDDGHVLTTPVSFHWGADLLAALGVADAWQLGVALPLVLVSERRSPDRPRDCPIPAR